MQVIRHDNPGKRQNIIFIVQASNFTNEQACRGEFREQWAAIENYRGNTIDLVAQGVASPA